MTVVKFDVSGSDPEKATTDFTPPKPGVYTAKILACNPGHTDNDKTRPRLEVTIVITAKEYKDARVYDYIGLTEASAWKLDQFLQALGLADKKKRKGQFDTAKILNKALKVRIKGDNYNDEYRAKVGSYLGLGADSEAPAEEEGEELEETEAEEIEEAEVESEFDEEARTEELMGAELPDVRKIMREYGIPDSVKGRKPMVAAVIEHERALSEAEPEEAEEAEEEEAEEVEEVEAETEDDGYDELDLAELKKECKDRKLSSAGTMAKLIARLRENDAADEEPF